MTQGKLKGLAVQRDQIETTLAQLCSCLQFMRESLRTGSEGDVLKMKTNTVRQVKELTIPFQQDILEPSTDADIVFSVRADMTSTCQNYGQVFAAGLPDPSKCHVAGKVAEVAVVGEKCTAILQAINFGGELCKGSRIKSLKCIYVSEITGIEASCSVERSCSMERSGQSQYEINYQPTIKGRHQLHIKVQGQHIRGSPFGVAVTSPVEKLGTPILTIDEVDIPLGVAINRRGEVVVSRYGGVSVFSPSGEKLRSFDALLSGASLQEVAVDSDENILATDTDHHVIHRFTSEGQFLTFVGNRGSGHLQFSDPIGIAFNASNNKVYVTDSDNNRIQVLNFDLNFSSIFGKSGSGKGQFGYPHGITCDSTGKVYVADCSNHRIQVFTAEGKFLHMFGRRGRGRGELSCPVGVAVDTSGMVYVSEEDNHRVSVFTSEGRFVTSFGRKGKGPGEFERPRGLAVDNSGVVYVCDLENYRIQLF